MIDANTQTQQAEPAEASQKEKMCCEGGMSAAEHGAKSLDGKCCTD
jgi:hypothetical protein